MQSLSKTMTFTRPDKQAAAKEFETSEFELLFEQQWERLCLVLYRITGDAHEAQDLALETFERLYRFPPADRSNLNGWLYRVASNLGFNALRASKRRRFYEEQAVNEDKSSSTAADPEADAGKRIEQQRVRQVLRSMKPRFARLLVLRFSGLTYAELAEAEGVRVSSVGTLLARAEKQFERLYLSERSEKDAP